MPTGKTIEIELRYEIVDQAQLSHFLTSAQHLGTSHDIDIYFDTCGARLWERGLFVRTRNNRTLDIKFNRACLDDPTRAPQNYCEEHVFELPLKKSDQKRLGELLVGLNLEPTDQADFELFKRTNNLFPHYTVAKTRTTYRYGEFTLAVDTVVDLGAFIEIELMTNSADELEAVKARMRRALEGLNLKPLERGYAAMLLRKNDFKNYIKGRYVCEADRAPQDKILA